MRIPAGSAVQLKSALSLVPVHEIVCGWNEIHIDDGTGLDELQVRLPDGAPDGQVVIGYCSLLGDPIGVDCTLAGFPVWSHQHDEASWEPEMIAGSLDAFGKAAGLVGKLCAGRDSEAKPVTDAEIEQLFRAIRAADRGAGEDFWRLFLDK